MKYVLGLDVGISSVGWAVICNDDNNKRIEDFGVRLFDSSESDNGKNRTSQQRRGFRSSRRLVRRRSHRKQRLKLYLDKIGLVHQAELEAYFEQTEPDPLELRVKGLSERLSSVQLAACLIHISNHRGYRDFYQADEESLSKEELKEYREERQGVARIKQLLAEGDYRTTAELFLHHPAFNNPNGGTVRS